MQGARGPWFRQTLNPKWFGVGVLDMGVLRVIVLRFLVSHSGSYSTPIVFRILLKVFRGFDLWVVFRM